jgi:hypothetical protein
MACPQEGRGSGQYSGIRQVTFDQMPRIPDLGGSNFLEKTPTVARMRSWLTASARRSSQQGQSIHPHNTSTASLNWSMVTGCARIKLVVTACLTDSKACRIIHRPRNLFVPFLTILETDSKEFEIVGGLEDKMAVKMANPKKAYSCLKVSPIFCVSRTQCA